MKFVSPDPNCCKEIIIIIIIIVIIIIIIIIPNRFINSRENSRLYEDSNPGL